MYNIRFNHLTILSITMFLIGAQYFINTYYNIIYRDHKNNNIYIIIL